MTTTIYHAANAAKAAEAAIYNIAQRGTAAVNRWKVNVPEPLKRLPPIDETRVPSMPTLAGYGWTLSHRVVHTTDGKSVGSVAIAIMQALSPHELAGLLADADRVVAEYERIADERESAVAARVAEALVSEDAALRAIVERSAPGRAAWINQRGSRRLKRLLAEGIEHEAVYRDERLAMERPGWEWEPDEIALHSPRNPPEEALDLLDRARTTAPDAVLMHYVAEADGNDDEMDQPSRERGYVAAANFLSRTIVSCERLVN